VGRPGRIPPFLHRRPSQTPSAATSLPSSTIFISSTFTTTHKPHPPHHLIFRPPPPAKRKSGPPPCCLYTSATPLLLTFLFSPSLSFSSVLCLRQIEILFLQAMGHADKPIEARPQSEADWVSRLSSGGRATLQTVKTAFQIGSPVVSSMVSAVSQWLDKNNYRSAAVKSGPTTDWSTARESALRFLTQEGPYSSPQFFGISTTLVPQSILDACALYIITRARNEVRNEEAVIDEQAPSIPCTPKKRSASVLSAGSGTSNIADKISKVVLNTASKIDCLRSYNFLFRPVDRQARAKQISFRHLAQDSIIDNRNMRLTPPDLDFSKFQLLAQRFGNPQWQIGRAHV